MSYNGSGTFNINSAGQPVVTGTTITSTAFNLLTADLATGLSTALTKDGQSTPTANIPMGTFKITGLGAGTAATDAAQYGQLQAGATTIAVVTGTDTLTGTLTPAITAYATGNLFSFVAANTNTGAATIALNGLAAKNITKTGSTALAAGDIVSGRVYLIEYDGTRFQLLNPSASSVASFSAGSTGFTPSSATTGAVTLAGTLATTNGGTGLTSFTANQVFYASSTSAFAQSSNLQFSGTDLTVYGLTVGRGAGAVSTNTAVGASALAANTSGADNASFGRISLASNTSGGSNSGFGSLSLNANTTGSNNSGIGYAALYLTTTGAYNTAVGSAALQNNTTASSNTAVGYQAGYSNTTGADMTAIGIYALYANTTGSQNTAIGRQALVSNTAASNNTALGYQAGYANATGTDGVYIGANAGRNSTLTGFVAVGSSAGLNKSSSDTFASVFVGTSAGGSVTTGTDNTFVGGYSGRYVTTGNANTAVGSASLGGAANTGSGNTAVGAYWAGSVEAPLFNNTTGGQNTAMGPGALKANTTGSTNIAIGNYALQSNTTASNNTAVGYQSGYSLASGGSVGLSALGYKAGYAYNTGGASFGDTFIGYFAGQATSTGHDNAFIGAQAGYTNTTGSYNTAIGSAALTSSTTASNNTAVGYQAGYSNTTGGVSVFIGNTAGYSATTATGSTFVGQNAGYSVTTGVQNTFVGHNTDGTAAGYYVTTGAKNTIIGGYNGNQGGLDIRTASNYIVLSDGDGNPRGIFDNNGSYSVGGTLFGGRITSTFPNSVYGFVSNCTSTTGTAYYHRFLYNLTETGSITSTGTLTIYNTTSDYRAKNITGSLTGYKERLMSLQPKQGTWIADGSEFRGFVAHEFAEPYRASVTGEKDAVDENGNPKMQSMQASSSEVMADLVALMQEQQAIIESLKARLDAANL